MFSTPVVLKTFTTCARGAHVATCSAPDVARPTAKPERSALSGFVQSKSILPLRSPTARSTLSAASHGVASTMTAPKAAASAMLPARAEGPLRATSSRTFGSAGSRTPKNTACPRRAQRHPSVPPTPPVPITLIPVGSMLFSFTRTTPLGASLILGMTHRQRRANGCDSRDLVAPHFLDRGDVGLYRFEEPSDVRPSPYGDQVCAPRFPPDA